MTALWTDTQAVAATGGTATAPFAATGISIDSRSLQPGDLFIALKAARDGHDFVAKAFESGAAAALVEHVPEGVTGPCLVVPDVMAALSALGAAGRARTRARVVGVTGSVGKTSTKEMLREMLGEFGPTHVSQGSFNNHWGVPITLARLPVDCAFAVVEIGMNRRGEIEPLARLARPDVALITTVAPAHLEALGSLEAIAEEKSDIFRGLEPDGIAVFPSDLSVSAILSKAAPDRRIPFGDGGDIRLTSIRQTDRALVAAALVDDMTYYIRLSDAGRHFAANALACLGVAKALGLDLAMAAQALGRWHPPAGRGLRERLLLDPATEASVTLIDDAFNANPTSMAAALEVLAATKPGPGGRRIAILGDMLELGPEEAALHAGLASHPALAQIDLVHCVGPRMAALHDALPPRKRGRKTDRAEALGAQAHALVHDGDVVLVKGSKGSYVSRVVDALRHLGHVSDETGDA
ncbi:MAG: UDP-N-acetylmuramoyl-tripeptide--D-alanyl-D-alanine ligase [Pararhodobacter sp.]